MVPMMSPEKSRGRVGLDSDRRVGFHSIGLEAAQCPVGEDEIQIVGVDEAIVLRDIER